MRDEPEMKGPGPYQGSVMSLIGWIVALHRKQEGFDIPIQEALLRLFRCLNVSDPERASTLRWATSAYPYYLIEHTPEGVRSLVERHLENEELQEKIEREMDRK